MNKKIIFSIFLFFGIFPILANASTGSLVKVGNKYYETLDEAIENAGPNDIISLISDVELTETLQIDKKVNLNLNGNDITALEIVFLVQGGTLNITGEGAIKETKPNYGAIMLKGSTNPDVKEYSVVNIEENVTLEGWSGIFVTHDNSKSYGVKVNLAGKINAINDTSGGTGVGIYINGNIKDEVNPPTVTILDNAKITSTGNGLYIAGYGIFNINEAEIYGVESGIGIKAGILNIDGATVKGTGPDATPTAGYNNGIKASGTSIQIESNSSYAGDIEVNIDDGTFVSNNSYTIYEYIGKGSNSQVIALDISGGTFISGKSKNNFLLSDSLKKHHYSFISGGEYSTNPSEYLKSGYTSTLEDDTYVVTQSTMKGVFGDNYKENNDNFIFITTVIILSVISIITLYINRIKILNILRK